MEDTRIAGDFPICISIVEGGLQYRLVSVSIVFSSRQTVVGKRELKDDMPTTIEELT